MKTMHKFSILFLMSIIVTSSSYSMDHADLERSGWALSKVFNMFQYCRRQKEHQEDWNTIHWNLDDTGFSCSKTIDSSKPTYMLSDTLIESLFKLAPTKAKKIVDILNDSNNSSDKYNRYYRMMLFVGDPGTGKSDTAEALAAKAGWHIERISGKDIRNEHRSKTALNFIEKLESIIKRGRKTLIVIDEINRLFENYDSEKHDNGDTAEHFWVFMDEQRRAGHTNFYIIGTMNRGSKLPPAFRSRSRAKWIAFNRPMTLESTKDVLISIFNDGQTMQLDDECDNIFLDSFLLPLHKKRWNQRDWLSLAEVSLLASNDINEEGKSLIKRKHLQEGLQDILDGDKLSDYYQKESEADKDIQERHHRENMRMQQKGLDLQEQLFVKGTYVQKAQSNQSTIGANGGLSLGAGTPGFSVGISGGGSYSRQGITKEGAEETIRMFSNKDRAFACKQFEREFKEHCKIAQENIQKFIVVLEAIKNKNLTDLRDKTIKQLAQLKKEFAHIQKSFKATKARLDVNTAESIATLTIKAFGEKVLNAIPSEDTIKKDEEEKKRKDKIATLESRRATTQNDSTQADDIAISSNFLSNSFFDANDTSSNQTNASSSDSTTKNATPNIKKKDEACCIIL